MEYFVLVVIFILGLCVGSFVNMLIYRTAVRYRLLRRKTPRNDKWSFCDYCGTQLKWYENIPVISWVVQGGKSRCCGKKLPVSYPLLELGTGTLFLIQFSIFPAKLDFAQLNNFQFSINFILGLVIITLLVFSAGFDLKYMILPDFSTAILIAMVFLGIVFDEKNIIPYLLSAIGASGFLGLLHLITKGKGMGLGDVKLAVFMGLFLGWPKIVVAFYVAFIGGAIVGVILMALKKVKRNSEIPFGPFLILGNLIAWYYGKEIWTIIGGLLH